MFDAHEKIKYPTDRSFYERRAAKFLSQQKNRRLRKNRKKKRRVKREEQKSDLMINQKTWKKWGIRLGKICLPFSAETRTWRNAGNLFPSPSSMLKRDSFQQNVPCNQRLLMFWSCKKGRRERWKYDENYGDFNPRRRFNTTTLSLLIFRAKNHLISWAINIVFLPCLTQSSRGFSTTKQLY